jgi:hypothetical protein
MTRARPEIEQADAKSDEYKCALNDNFVHPQSSDVTVEVCKKKKD